VGIVLLLFAIFLLESIYNSDTSFYFDKKTI